MRKKYILLDWDGTMAKTLDLWLEVYKDAVEKRGVKVENDYEFVEIAFGKWEKGFEAAGVKDPRVAYKEAIAMAEEKMPDVELYPNVEKVLQIIKAGGSKIGLLTSSFRHLVEPPMKKNGLDKYFDIVITKDETEVGKPDPWIVNTALEKLGGNKEEAVFVGDSIYDIQAANSAGVTSVLFYPEHNHKFYRKEFLMQHNPDHVISSLLEIVDIRD